MKTALFCSMIVLGVMPLTASAEEVSSSFSWGAVTFQPRAYIGYADYELKSSTFTFTPAKGDPYTSSLKFNAQGNDKIPLSGFIGGIGGTIATGQFFGDFYYQSTLNETAYSNMEEQKGDVVYRYGDVDAKHYDWALSLGYMITEQWSVFAGYKSGKTNWDQSYNYNDPVSDLFHGSGSTDGKFEQNGPFLGTSYSFQIGPGALTFKIAYAYLDGEYEDNSQGKSYIIEPQPVLYNQVVYLDGNSNAYSLGLSWTQSLTDNLGYSIGLNYHRYEFDLSGSGTLAGSVGGGFVITTPINGEISSGTLTEELFTLTAAMTYRF
ncbi:MAG: hypothetical protein F9K25_10465 [Candidatus Contendobacter sp.]|nr:MAG: hypothetical protein F9K25_10465 [Candidatus Contendobacter sp.]